jgi:hypothetical protein
MSYPSFATFESCIAHEGEVSRSGTAWSRASRAMISHCEGGGLGEKFGSFPPKPSRALIPKPEARSAAPPPSAERLVIGLTGPPPPIGASSAATPNLALWRASPSPRWPAECGRCAAGEAITDVGEFFRIPVVVSGWPPPIAGIPYLFAFRCAIGLGSEHAVPYSVSLMACGLGPVVAPRSRIFIVAVRRRQCPTR